MLKRRIESDASDTLGRLAQARWPIMPVIALPYTGRHLNCRHEVLKLQVRHAWEQNMRYVFLVHQDEARWNTMSIRKRDALKNACQANEHDLQQSGHLFAIEDPYSTRTTLTVQIVSGEVSVTETPGQLIRLTAHYLLLPQAGIRRHTIPRRAATQGQIKIDLVRRPSKKPPSPS